MVLKLYILNDLKKNHVFYNKWDPLCRIPCFAHSSHPQAISSQQVDDAPTQTNVRLRSS